MAQWKQNWRAFIRTQVQSLALCSGLRIGIAMSCGVGHRHGSDLTLMWLWRRPAAAAPVQPLAREPPYGHKKTKKKKEKKKRKRIFLQRVLQKPSLGFLRHRLCFSREKSLYLHYSTDFFLESNVRCLAW